MRRILTNTTALVACLSLSLPLPVTAQQENQAEDSELCVDGSAPPCEAGDAAPAGEPAEAPAEAEATEEAAPAPEAAEAAEPSATPEPAADAPDAAEAAEEPAATPEPAEVTDAPAATPEAATEEPVATPEATEATEAPAAAPEARGEEPAAEPEAAEVGGDPAAPEAAADEPAAAAEEAEPTAASQEVQAESADAATEEGAEVGDGPAPAEVIEMEEPVESEADIAVDIENETGSDTSDQAEAQEPAAAAAPEGDAAEAAAPPRRAETTAETPPEAEPNQAAAAAAQPQQSEEEQAEAEAAAAEEAAQSAQRAAAATADADAEATVTEETVTEETSRSSDENFGSRLTDALGLDDEETRTALLAGVLGTLGGYTASQLLGDRQIVASSQDRVVVQRADGQYQLLKDDNALLRQPGSEVRTETFSDGSTRTTVVREDGSRIVTVRDPELRVVRRTKVTPDGQEWLLIDDTAVTEAIDVRTLPQATAETGVALSDEEALRRALDEVQRSDRRYSLAQVREVQSVRAQAPVIQIDSVTFETGSAAISADQARQLNELGQLLSRMIEENPREIFLVEGHTDAVGDAAMNLALSDRRAESVALALTEYFDVPPENLVVQGYGERYLRVQTEDAEQQNRRAAVRRITGLLQIAAAN